MRTLPFKLKSQIKAFGVILNMNALLKEASILIPQLNEQYFLYLKLPSMIEL